MARRKFTENPALNLVEIHLLLFTAIVQRQHKIVRTDRLYEVEESTPSLVLQPC